MRTLLWRPRRPRPPYASCALYALCALLLFAARPVAAQGAFDPLATGTVVRFRAPTVLAGRVVARVIAVHGDTLHVRPLGAPLAGTTFTLPPDALATLERRAGRDRAAGARRGTLVGLVAGVGLGFACVALCPRRVADGANLAPIGGLFYGPPVGAALGAIVAPVRWQVVPLPSRPERN